MVANGENVAGGLGITPRTADKLLAAGIDVLTTGNHVYRHRDVYELPRHKRPHRAAGELPRDESRAAATRWSRRTACAGGSSTSAATSSCRPRTRRSTWSTACSRSCAARPTTSSSTSTPRRPARRSRWAGTSTVACWRCVGTHTHVPTADGRVLPGGTAFISDVGMTGARGGVIGVKKEQILERFMTQMPVKFETADEDVWVMGVPGRDRATTASPGRSSRSWCRLGRPTAGSRRTVALAPTARSARAGATTRCTGRTSARARAAGRSARRRRAPRPAAAVLRARDQGDRHARAARRRPSPGPAASPARPPGPRC